MCQKHAIMKKICTLLIFTGLFIFLLSMNGIAEILPAPFKVIPQPKEVILLKRVGLKYGELQNLQRQGDFKRPVMGEILSEITEFCRKDKGTLTLILEEKGGVPMSPEGYVLKISSGNAEIISRGEAGVYKTTYDGKIDARQAEEMWKQGEPKFLEVIDNIPGKCVFMRWNYTMGTQPGNMLALDWYHDHGLHSMIATAAQSGPAAPKTREKAGKS